jgi:membrane-bound ClpP family serine protease
VYRQATLGITFSFALAGVAGVIGVLAMITGAVMLARETTYSFRILKEERRYITEHVSSPAMKLADTPPSARN